MMLPVYHIVFHNSAEWDMNGELWRTRKEVVKAYWSPIQAFHSWKRKKSSNGIADLRVEMWIHNLPNNFRNTQQQTTANL